MVEDIDSMLVEGVVWPKQGYHEQQGELVLVEESWGWEGARENVWSWGWGVRMEALESLESDALVKRENLHFTWRETECGQYTEQFRRRVAQGFT